MEWVKLGIVPERSRPASPQDNGRHERMHSTLKQATLRPPERTARRQQDAFDRFQHEYNHERPHESLEDRTPAACYQPSPRQMPRRTPELEYGDDVELRRVSQQGSVKMRGARTFVSEIFAYEWLGLRPLDERYFEVLYDQCGWDFWTPGSTLSIVRCTSRSAAGWAGVNRKPVEMPAGGKPGNPETGFPPFPPSLEIASDFHIPTGSTIPL